MIQAVPDILARIVAHKRTELADIDTPGSVLDKQAADMISERRDFAAALVSKKPAIIAEIKQASPSKGTLSPDFRPAETATEYEAGGAAALSVLTDSHFFKGSLKDLVDVRRRVGLPVLRKDFTIDRSQIVEAAAHGADAILLIAAILTEREMTDFRQLAGSYGMTALVEVHNEDELDVALGSGAQVVGVNNRDLHTFDVSLETSLRLAERIPDTVLKVSESGIHGRRDIELLMNAGYSAFLVGEHLMRSGDPRSAVSAMIA